VVRCDAADARLRRPGYRVADRVASGRAGRSGPAARQPGPVAAGRPGCCLAMRCLLTAAEVTAGRGASAARRLRWMAPLGRWMP